MKRLRWTIIAVALLALVGGLVRVALAQLNTALEINLSTADMAMVGEDVADWTGYFASPAGDVNGDGLGDLIIGAPLAGNKVCPIPGEDPCTGLPKGEGETYLVLGRPRDQFPVGTMNLVNADASFLGCDTFSMTGRQIYTAGDVNNDGYDDFLISGWKCGTNFTGKTYLILGRPDVDFWGSEYPVEQANASFLGEQEWDEASYYTATAGDVNNDGYDDFLITATHYENDNPCEPGLPPEECGTCCRNSLASTEILTPSSTISATWGIGDEMHVARFAHTATSLPDGKVLVAGGRNVDSFVAGSEVFNPVSNSWELTGSLNITRSAHVAVALLDGDVLVAGGENSSGLLGSAERFDLASGTWSLVDALSSPRIGHAAVRLQDGRVMVSGGENGVGFVNDVELFDPGTDTWATTTPMSDTRSNHTASLLPSGQVLVVGGQNAGGYLATAELWDPVTGLWTPTGGLTTARADHSVAPLADGKLLVTGGKNQDGYLRSAEIYDPLTGLWTEVESLKHDRMDHVSLSLPNGMVIVLGGQNDTGSESRTEFFDPISATWTTVVTRSFQEGRVDLAAALLPDGNLLVAGGRDCTNFGKTYLFLGRPTINWGLDFPIAQADASFVGEAPEDRLGRAAVGVGDVNNDGYGDFVVGSISSDAAGVNAGQNYLFLGRDSNGPDWWGHDYSVVGADASFLGEAAYDEAGRRVAWAGDVNADGYDDFMIGAALNDHTARDAGSGYLILGRAAADWGMKYSLSQADASFPGEFRFDQAGRRLNGAGDVNGDGYDDFLIGAPHYERNGFTVGAAYLIYGRAAADWGMYYPLEQADVRYVGKDDVGVAGYDIGWLNDFDGDGIDDMLIAAFGGRNNNTVPGEVYVVLGDNLPQVLDFTSDAAEGYVGAWQRFSGDFWEPNTWQDVAYAELIVGRQLDDPRGLAARYEPAGNALYLRDSDGIGWLGPCAPGQETRLSNGIVELDCKGSDARGDKGKLRIMWRARWLQPVAGSTTLNTSLRVEDLAGHDSGYVSYGTWDLWWQDLMLTKRAAQKPPLSAGDAITYTLTFSNVSDTLATQVVISDPVPAEVLNAGFSSNYPVIVSGTTPYNWVVDNLAPGAKGTISLWGTVATGLPPGLVFTNTASISAAAPDANPTNNRRSAELSIQAAPLAADDAYTAFQNKPLTVTAPGVLTNDLDPNGTPLKTASASQPTFGTVALHPDGSFVYMPNPGWLGVDSFTYYATDAISNSNMATVYITVVEHGAFQIYLPLVAKQG